MGEMRERRRKEKRRKTRRRRRGKEAWELEEGEGVGEKKKTE
jgi:hypothetical protein